VEDSSGPPTDLAGSAFRRHYQQVYSFLLRRTRNAEAAEELAQQVFADAASALEHFKPGKTPVLALLYTIAQRRFADATRDQLRHPRSFQSLDALADSLPVNDRDELVAGALRDALEQLRPDAREVVVMKLVHGCTFAEIASHTGVKEAACRKRFQRALEDLRVILEQHGFGED